MQELYMIKKNIKKNTVTDGYFNASDNCDKAWKGKILRLKNYLILLKKNIN